MRAVVVSLITPACANVRMSVPQKRGWFRFSLRTMFVVVAAVAISNADRETTLFDNADRHRTKSGDLRNFAGLGAERPTLAADSSIWHWSSRAETRHLTPSNLSIRWCVSGSRRMAGDVSWVKLRIPRSLAPAWIERVENAFPESKLSMIGPRDNEIAFRDSLYARADRRKPNTGSVFKTGLIEK